MTLLLVRHATPLPALDGMVAGMFAAARGATLVPLTGGGAGHGRFDCVQHVLAHGELAPNGLIWAERATGRAVPAPVDRGAVVRLPGIIVVPLNPALPAHQEAQTRLLATAARAGRPVELFEVEEVDDVFTLRSAANEVAGRWRRDIYGRPVAADTIPRTASSPARKVLLVGPEDQQRDVYPATLAALGDAADALGIELDMRFIDPRDEPDWDRALREIDGLVLPGGSDMEQVPGQIDAARAALRRDVPTIGLCLGLQTMATAVAQEVCGLNEVNLAETDPNAQTLSFVRLHDAYGRPMHRLGLERCRLTPGSRLADLAGSESLDVLCNHRFVLDPVLEPRLVEAGLVVSARQAGNDHADAIEVPALRFFLAMQGHPELSSRPGRPHPLLNGFLAAMATLHLTPRITD